MRRAVTWFLCALALLLATGLVLVYSASSTFYRVNANYFVIRQTISLALSLAAGSLVAQINYRFWSRLGSVVAIVLLVLAGTVAVFFFEKINGSHRWINLGFYQLQPSEFAKIGILMVLAAWFDRVGPRSSRFLRGFLVPGLIVGVLTVPILLAPDFGSTLVILVVAGTIFLAAGTRFRHLLAGLLVALGSLAVLIVNDTHRMNRVRDFWNGLFGEGGAQAHQTVQSINAFVIGGPLGVGLNNSIQKYRYLPEAHTDCIYAIAGEELGLLASAGIILLFGALLASGAWIAYRARDRFGRFMGLGLTILLCFEAGFNMGMVMGCLPTKGLALPFLSYGGSSLMASMIAVGLLLNIARQAALAEDEAPSRMRNALRRI
jgi:cell division protein FtsW